MKRLATAALALSVVLPSCAGHGGSALPASPASPGTQSKAGARTTRAAALAVAPTGWATTNTGVLNLANATDLGAISATQPITVHVGLQLRNVDQLQQFVASGQTMDPGSFTATYGPTSDQVAQVTSYLQSQGFTNIAAEPNNLLVDATAPASVVQKAFNTTLHSFTQNGLTVYANTSPAYVPQNLSSVVVAVLGLNSAQAAAAKPRKQVAPAPSPTPDSCTQSVNTTTGTAVCPRWYDPATYQLTYDVGNVPPATNTAVAIMTEGQLSQSISDLRYNESQFKLPQVPISIVHVQPMSSDTSGNDEWTLDMLASTTMAGNVKTLYLYNFASLSDSDIVTGFNRWVTDDKAKVANASFGGCEVFPYQDGAMLMADEVLVQAAAQGQTLFVSTGDTGGYCGLAGVPPNGAAGGLPFVEWPAASPYVTAVGGTDLFSNPDGSYLGEDAWEAGGGGLSQFEYGPYWESGVQPVSSTPVGFTFRGVPDVSMDAGLETGAYIYLGGTLNEIGGTSLASPLAAGVWARLQSSHGNALGFAPLKLYHMYSLDQGSPTSMSAGPPPWQMIGGFHDILSGTNGLYTAAPKFDYTTGMGSFDVSKMNALIGQ
ncbi:MAG TPA: S53 family peptidase [Candidatus Aquilonibacter sp.]|nr:S53 family peptidase [Candidatus Aquilonibacter sp.]